MAESTGRLLVPLKAAVGEVRQVASLATRVRARQKATERGLKDPLAETHRQTRGLTRRRFAKSISLENAPCRTISAPEGTTSLVYSSGRRVDARTARIVSTRMSKLPGRRLVRRRRPLAKSRSPQKTKRKKDQEDVAAAGGIVRRRPQKGRPLSSSLLRWWPSAVVFASIQSRQRLPSRLKGEIYLIPCYRSCGQLATAIIRIIPLIWLKKQARFRAKALARSLRTKTADDIMKSCAPASAGPKGQPAKSCMKPSTKDTPIVAPVTPGQWIIDSGSAFDIVSRSDLTAPQKKQIMFDGSVTMQTA